MVSKKNTKLSRIRDRTHENVDNVMDKAEDISNSSKDIISNQKDKVIRLRDSISNYIQEKPKRSVLIAAGVGAILAKIITLKRR